MSCFKNHLSTPYLTHQLSNPGKLWTVQLMQGAAMCCCLFNFSHAGFLSSNMKSTPRTKPPNLTATNTNVRERMTKKPRSLVLLWVWDDILSDTFCVFQSINNDTHLHARIHMHMSWWAFSAQPCSAQGILQRRILDAQTIDGLKPWLKRLGEQNALYTLSSTNNI